MFNKTKTKNQTEGEFFSLVATGRKGVEDMLSKMGGELLAVAASNVAGAMDTWKTRALVSVMSNDALKGIVQSRVGIFSIYEGLAKAATMGLQPGGNYPHFHFMPKSGKAVFVPTAEGLAFCATYGPGAVLAKVPEIIPVYEKDKLSLDQAGKKVRHEYDPFIERGKLVGWYAEIEYNNGAIEIPTVTQAKVEKIKAEYSNTTTSKGGVMPAWAKSEFDMLKKIAAKQLLKKPAAEAEGLAMLYTQDGAPMSGGEPLEPDMRDVTERMSDRLDSALEGMDKKGNVSETQAVPSTARSEKPSSEPEPEPGDLF